MIMPNEGSLAWFSKSDDVEIVVIRVVKSRNKKQIQEQNGIEVQEI